MNFKTADLCDEHREHLQIAQPIFRHFGGRRAFYGEIATVKVVEDNSLVRQRLELPGGGQVLVVDGGGSLRCALVGDVLASFALKNQWAGIVVYGCVRDAAELASIEVGVLALNTFPARGTRPGGGQSDLPISFAGVVFTPGAFLYADEDGLIVSGNSLFEGSTL